ncbi:MAG: pyridoxamine 5'-phosphate oxidase family protein, partial [Pseudomonadales bacterium]|nr:pyridoxamine 5'-phosphate oxidase family protein [Pseudomonadales bacterium]
LATVGKDGRPRMHPFVPKIIDGRLIAFIVNLSYKYHDLMNRRWFAIHAVPGEQDEEFYIAGRAERIDSESAFRQRAYESMGFVHEMDDIEVMFEFTLDRALHTTWLDFGTKDHRPQFRKWRL